MKIALVSREYPPFYGGGIGTFAEAATRAFVAAGHDVRVVTQGDGADAVERRGGAEVHRIALPGGGATWGKQFLSFAARAGRLVAGWHADGAIDVAEFADTEAASIATAWSRALGGPRVPIVLGLHTCSELVSALGSLEPDLDVTRLALFVAERVAAAEADGWCSPSRYNAEWYRRFYGLPETPAVVRYPLAEAPVPPAPIGARRVLYMGRVEPRKGVAPLLAAWPSAARACPGWSLRLVGRDTRTAPDGGSLAGALRRALPDDVRGTVDFAGVKPREELAVELAGAAIVVIPSLWDNFPNTCMEAMGAGRAVIVGDVGGTREMVEGSAGGLAVPSGDAPALAAALTQLMRETPAALAARGQAAQDRIVELCDPVRTTRERVDVYRAAIERAKRAGGRRPRGARLAAWRLLREAGQRGHGAFRAVETPRLDPIQDQPSGREPMEIAT